MAEAQELPLHSYTAGGHPYWQWEDWDGDWVSIDGRGNLRTETEAFVDLSPEQWDEIARVARHLADRDRD